MLRPLDLVVDDRGAPLGYIMRFAGPSYSLCPVIPRSFRERHGIGPDQAFQLVLRLRTGIENVHRAGVLLVDIHERNFLVDPSFQDICFIDVDSYQTPHYPATALLPVVRDWHATGGFSDGSDWFSFAVLSFQLLTGLHPYKGKHPRVRSLEERMKGNLSVFDPCVRTPAAWYGLDVIPDNYLSWFRAVLQEGKRLAPPADGKAARVAAAALCAPPSTLTVREVFAAPAPIRGAVRVRDGVALWTTEGVYHDRRRILDVPPGCFGVGFVPTTGRLVVAAIQGGTLALIDGSDGSPVPLALRADEAMTCGGRIYVRSRDRIVEIRLLQAGDKLVAVPQVAGQVLPLATRLWPGVALQNLLGAVYASVYPRTGESRQVRLPELDGACVMSAAFDRGVLMVHAERGGAYQRWVFRFDQRDSGYDARREAGDPAAEVSFAVLDNGVCVALSGEDEVEVFSSARGDSGLRRIEDVGVSEGRLVTDGSRLLTVSGQTLRWISLTSPPRVSR